MFFGGAINVGKKVNQVYENNLYLGIDVIASMCFIVDLLDWTSESE